MSFWNIPPQVLFYFCQMYISWATLKVAFTSAVKKVYLPVASSLLYIMVMYLALPLESLV